MGGGPPSTFFLSLLGLYIRTLGPEIQSLFSPTSSFRKPSVRLILSQDTNPRNEANTSYLMWTCLGISTAQINPHTYLIYYTPLTMLCVGFSI